MAEQPQPQPTREELIRNLKENGYLFEGDRIYSEQWKIFPGIGRVAVQFDLGYLTRNQPVINFDSSAPLQAIKAYELFNRLRTLGVSPIVSPARDGGIFFLKQTGKLLEQIADLMAVRI